MAGEYYYRRKLEVSLLNSDNPKPQSKDRGGIGWNEVIETGRHAPYQRPEVTSGSGKAQVRAKAQAQNSQL